MGNSLSKVITAAEIFKRRFKGRRQVSNLDSTEIIAEYEPFEEGLDKIVETRNAPPSRVGGAGQGNDNGLADAGALRLVRRVLGQRLRRRRAPVCCLHWSLSGRAPRPGRQWLVPRDGCHLDSSAPRVSAHLLLGDLRFCNEPCLSP